MHAVFDHTADERDLAAGRHHLHFLAAAGRGGIRRRLSHLTHNRERSARLSQP